jgi:hypothetical protein
MWIDDWIYWTLTQLVTNHYYTQTGVLSDVAR